MTELYVLQSGAADDLRSIIRYTRETWGVAQARAYSEKLREGIQRLVKGEASYRTLEDISTHPCVSGAANIITSFIFGVRMHLRLLSLFCMNGWI